jgi:hypothetical protein
MWSRQTLLVAYGVTCRLREGAKLLRRNSKGAGKSARESAYAAVANVIADVDDLAVSVQEQGASRIKTKRGKKMKGRQAGNTAESPRKMIRAGKADFASERKDNGCPICRRISAIARFTDS